MTLDVGYVLGIRTIITGYANDTNAEFKAEVIQIAESFATGGFREYETVDASEKFPFKRGDPVVVAHHGTELTNVFRHRTVEARLCCRLGREGPASCSSSPAVYRSTISIA